jgi:hypothetical protein
MIPKSGRTLGAAMTRDEVPMINVRLTLADAKSFMAVVRAPEMNVFWTDEGSNESPEQRRGETAVRGRTDNISGADLADAAGSL